ncbi:hypothetical protein KEM56_003924 [Ascosphaera pollenicola]|nr:hypothetical protein KEM56_003924 [Ascosphaera pollenicola]
MSSKNVPENVEGPETPPPASPEPKQQSAFTALMERVSPRDKRVKKIHEDKSSKKAKYNPRDALFEYIETPENFSPSTVLYYDEKFVLIKDKFPKSSLHLLLLPRNREKTWMHPIAALEDIEFLQEVRAEAYKVGKFAASELGRIHGKYSAKEKARQDAMSADPIPDELPEGRDWENELQYGIHAGPSMNNLHIHIMSVDRSGPCLKHRKHYNSFSTPFFIPLKDFPLSPDDKRRTLMVADYLHEDLKCWRCGKNFGNAFTRLAAHLQEELEEWKKI